MHLVGKDSGDLLIPIMFSKTWAILCLVSTTETHLFLSHSPPDLQVSFRESYWKLALVDDERALGASCLGCEFLSQASIFFPVLNVPEACAVVPGVSSEQWERQQAGAVTVRRSGFPLLLSQCLMWLTWCERASWCHHSTWCRESGTWVFVLALIALGKSCPLSGPPFPHP